MLFSPLLIERIHTQSLPLSRIVLRGETHQRTEVVSMRDTYSEVAFGPEFRAGIGQLN
jgi:hypothetical protein